MEGKIPADYRQAKIIDLPKDWQKALMEVYMTYEQRKPGGCLLQGPNGVGKSHGACALAKDLYAGGFLSRPPVYTLAEEINTLWREWDHFRECWFETTFKNARLLIIDDLGKEDRSTQKIADSNIHRIGAILRSRAQHRLPTFITTNFGEEDLNETYGASIVSLLHGNGPWLELSGPDRRRGK